MNIQAMQFLNAEQTAARVTTVDGKSLTVPWPCRTWHNEAIQEWLSQGNVIAPVPETPLAELKQTKLDEINAAYTAVMEPLLKTYPDVETKGWDAQRNEAEAYQAWLDAGSSGTPPVTPVLDKILTGRNGVDGTETLAELTTKVLANAQAFIDAQEQTGYRHRLEKQIELAETVADVEAVAW